MENNETKTFNPDVESDAEDGVFWNKKVKHYCFNTKSEAAFIGALKDFAPNSDDEKLIQVFSIISKLLNVESVYEFNKK